MSRRALLALVAAGALAGCATEPPPAQVVGVPAPRAAHPEAGPEPPAYGEPGVTLVEPVYADPRAGEWAVAALGTPFFAAFKAAVCAGSLAIAAPTSALMALSGPHARQEGLDVLGAGIAQNCGPPYVLSP